MSEQNNTYSNSNPGMNIKQVIVYSALGLVMAGGTIFLVKKAVGNIQMQSEEKKSLDENAPATYAKRIKMAFDNDGWWGTDEEALREVLRSIPSKEFYKQVAASYKKLYGHALTSDMQDELTSTEYQEMMMIIAAKPEKKGDPVVPNYLAWAKRLRAAVSVWYGIFPGTDEDAIKAVFLEIPTQAAFKQVEQAYYKEYADTLMDDLRGDLSSSDLKAMMKIIQQKPLK
jgi:hypothetical protein